MRLNKKFEFRTSLGPPQDSAGPFGLELLDIVTSEDVDDETFAAAIAAGRAVDGTRGGESVTVAA